MLTDSFRSAAAAALLVAFAFAPRPARAQPSPDRWKADVELGLNGASGNSSFSILQTGATVAYLRTEIASFEVTAGLRYGKSDSKVIANDSRASLKLDFHPKSDFSPFIFATTSRDRIRKLDFKSSGGLGANVTVWRGNAGKAAWSAAALYDYENFRLEPGSAGPGSRGSVRWSFRFTAERALGPGASFKHVSFFQPQWNALGDYLMDATNSVSTKIIESLSLVVRHEYLRDSVPPPGARRDDQRFSVVLRAAL